MRSAISKSKIKKTNEQFLNDLYNIHNNNIIAIDTYINNQTKIKFKCNICNHECPQCAITKTITIESDIDFYNKLQNIHYSNYSIITNYINNNIKIELKCNICNTVFQVLPLEILNTSGIFYPNCKKKYTKVTNNNYCVYYIKNIQNKNPIYVSITNDINQRFTRYFNDPSDILYQFHNQQ